MKSTDRVPAKSRWWHISLAKQILLGLVIGGLLGWLSPEIGIQSYFLRNIFLNLIKSIIAPLIFSTIVVGIAGGGELKKLGRMGVRAIIYFEVGTTIALFIGLAVVNITKPGYGVVLQVKGDDLGALGQSQPMGLIDTLVHIFPQSIIESMAR